MREKGPEDDKDDDGTELPASSDNSPKSSGGSSKSNSSGNGSEGSGSSGNSSSGDSSGSAEEPNLEDQLPDQFEITTEGKEHVLPDGSIVYY